MHYWSCGIKIKKIGPDWAISLDFYDNTFCQDDSTEGTLCVRYQVKDLASAIDILKTQAEDFGIGWRSPTIYCEQDGELADGDHPVLRELADEQSRRLGWKPAYTVAIRAHSIS